jgi:hypothetical protein
METVMVRFQSSIGCNHRERSVANYRAQRKNGVELGSLSIVVDPEDRYLALLSKFPLRPIRHESQYRAAIEILDRLFELGTERSVEEEDYFSVLALLAWDYENGVGDATLAGKIEC